MLICLGVYTHPDVLICVRATETHAHTHTHTHTTQFVTDITSAIGRRKHKVRGSYNEGEYYRNIMAANTVPGAKQKFRRRVLPKLFRLPQMQEWQFYDSARLREIGDIEVCVCVRICVWGGGGRRGGAWLVGGVDVGRVLFLLPRGCG
jgi:hypothetical protein